MGTPAGDSLVRRDVCRIAAIETLSLSIAERFPTKLSNYSSAFA
jgi:hypothetical protein